jgi:hypothetical protein
MGPAESRSWHISQTLGIPIVIEIWIKPQHAVPCLPNAASGKISTKSIAFQFGLA